MNGKKCSYNNRILIFFREPIDIAVDKEDRVVVADNGLSAILVFDPAGKLLKTIDGKRTNQKEGQTGKGQEAGKVILGQKL